ncbi:hypothetical protein ACEOWJ_003160 [Bacillus cereus]|nr:MULTISPECIES: hypothetical protein [unclassified Bacillus (in: firmicutes)]
MNNKQIKVAAAQPGLTIETLAGSQSSTKENIVKKYLKGEVQEKKVQ